MMWKSSLGAVLFMAAIPFAGSEVLGPAWSVAVVLFGIGAGWLLIPGFWRGVIHGGIAGVIAGLLVLGPGLRVAMRVVAMVDPTRSPEFTIGGTMFIIVGIGAVMGGIFGVFGNVSRIGFNIPSRAAGLVPALLVVMMIGLDSELRGEILELGVGPWLNIFMFGAVATAYGWVWARIVGRLEKGRLAKTRQGSPAPATMSLSDPRGHEI
ncbi:MAG TPA: hypothetical protein VJ948_04175 [Acidimicrobiia bacterium]|nr:hypothetical protein [Acidimicrobiia bacterium]